MDEAGLVAERCERENLFRFQQRIEQLVREIHIALNRIKKGTLQRTTGGVSARLTAASR